MCSSKSRWRWTSPTASASRRWRARHPQLVAMVGFVRRFDASYQQAKAQIDAGAIGRPFLVRSQTCDMNDPQGFFVRFAPTSGGIFMDCSVHDIDLARWMLGNPKRHARRLPAARSRCTRAWPNAATSTTAWRSSSSKAARARCSTPRARWRMATRPATEIIGTAGALSVGVGAHRDRVEMRDAHGVRHRPLLDFFERFHRSLPARDGRVRRRLPRREGR